MIYKILILCLVTIYKNDSESGEKVTPQNLTNYSHVRASPSGMEEVPARPCFVMLVALIVELALFAWLSVKI